jgi:hypothetical protein
VAESSWNTGSSSAGELVEGSTGLAAAERRRAAAARSQRSGRPRARPRRARTRNDTEVLGRAASPAQRQPEVTSGRGDEERLR